MSSAPLPPNGSWTFVTNHAAVLLCLARDSGIRMRDVADRVGITERAAQRIVADLANEGYVTRRSRELMRRGMGEDAAIAQAMREKAG